MPAPPSAPPRPAGAGFLFLLAAGAWLLPRLSRLAGLGWSLEIVLSEFLPLVAWPALALAAHGRFFWPRRRAARWWWHGLACGLAVIALIVGAGLGWVVARLAPPGSWRPIPVWPITPQSPLELLLMVGLVVVLAPLAEELFFRGWFIGLVRARGAAAWPTALVSAGLFTLFHDLGHAPLIFALGLACAWLRLGAGGWGPALTAHAVFNLIVLSLRMIPPF